MINKDEKNALKLLDIHNKIIKTSVNNFQGSIVKFIGDSVFAEFDRAQNAALSAIEIQSKIIERNTVNPKNDQFHIRIGLHLGDLVVKDNDLFGNTVNLGSRIEGAAPTDGILLSKEIYQKINKNKSFNCRSLGYIKLKNIKEPCELFKLYLSQLNFTSQSNDDLRKETIERGLEVVDMSGYSPIDAYSIGMLYFKNIGSDEHDVICQRISQDIIRDMYGINALRIPSIVEIDQFKDTQLPISEIARRMQVEYMVLGSIMKNGEEYKLNIQMQDMKNGSSCWEDEFAFKSIEINATKGKILLEILSFFNLAMPDHIEKYFQIEPTFNPQALDHYLQARNLMTLLRNKDDLYKARDHLDKAIILDPAFLYAHANKGWNSYLLGEYDAAEDELYSALELAEQDNLEMNDAYVLFYFGILYNKQEKYKKSIRHLKMSLEIYFKYDSQMEIAATLHNLGMVLTNSGKVEDGMDCFNRSLKIKIEFEDNNTIASSYNQIANAYLAQGAFTFAIDNSRKSLGYYTKIGNHYNAGITSIVLSDSYAQIGYFNEMEEYLKESKSVFSEFNNYFILGKIDALFGLEYFNTKQFKKSILSFESAIENLQIDDSRIWVLKYSIKMAQVFIFWSKWERALKVIERCKALGNKISNLDQVSFDTLNAMVLYIKCGLNELSKDELLKAIKTSLNNEDRYYLIWYYLGKSSKKLNMPSEYLQCFKLGQKDLRKKADLISNEIHRKSFLNNLLIHEELMKS
jgi:tetratricopeptide (TPR) repeat protein